MYTKSVQLKLEKWRKCLRFWRLQIANLVWMSLRVYTDTVSTVSYPRSFNSDTRPDVESRTHGDRIEARHIKMGIFGKKGTQTNVLTFTILPYHRRNSSTNWLTYLIDVVCNSVFCKTFCLNRRSSRGPPPKLNCHHSTYWRNLVQWSRDSYCLWHLSFVDRNRLAGSTCVCGPTTDGSRTIRRRTIRCGQFGADNSAWTIRCRTIRRGQFGADNSFRTIRRKVYIINFIQNPAYTQQYSFQQSRFHFSNFSSIPLPFRQLFHQFLSLTLIV